MSQIRQEKVAAEIRRVLASSLLTEVKDPRVLGVSLTQVSVSPDLQICRVHWLTSSEIPREEISKGLEKASAFLRRCIASELDLRRTPVLKFYYDEAFERGAKMQQLLKELRDSGQMGSDE